MLWRLMRKYIPVRFLRAFGKYNENDVATFEVERCNALVQAGVAIHHEEPVVEPAETEPKKSRSKKTNKAEVACQESLQDNPF